MNHTPALKWLSETPEASTPVSFGVPWKRGELRRDEKLALMSGSKAIPIHQHYNMAYWNDGSVKWTGHDAFIENLEDGYKIIKTNEQPINYKMASEDDGNIYIDTGAITAQIPKDGNYIIKSMHMGETELLSDACLVAIREERRKGIYGRNISYEDFISVTEDVTLEQDGSARCVISIAGKHVYQGTRHPNIPQRKWLPFKLRLYFYKNCEKIKIVHTFFYDGNPNKDFIKGIGLNYKMPMYGPNYNRYVRMSGDEGFFTESPKLLATIRTNGKYADMFRKQLAGENTVFTDEDQPFLKLLNESATWNEFTLVQDSSNHYSIKKRTKEGCSFVKAMEGNKSKGLLYYGSECGGISAGIKDFWQKHPTAFEVKDAAKDKADITLWLWSPHGEAMDLRHYDTDTHVYSSYEGFDEMRSTPYGIANTSEMSLWLCDNTPAHETLKQMEKEVSDPSTIICTPEYYRSAEAFGVWSLEDRTSEHGRKFEEEQDKCIELFKEQIQLHNWYGFWNYGDIMRFYDDIRHVWKYDLGGCAWNNSELTPDMWMWYAFLRSGRKDVFRLAEAYTRHGSEVDQYHFGDYRSLGSRHNVVHWGCGCKEARISMAGLNRFLYYITTDERMGEILDEVADADFSILNIDPLRTLSKKDNHPTHVRTSPDWAAFTSNWMTKWERYEDKTYKEKILAGIDCIKSFPHQLSSGPACGYYPKTGKLVLSEADSQSFHMANCFGTIPVWLELSHMLDNDDFKEMLADYGAFYPLSLEEKQHVRPDITSNNMYGMVASVTSISAFAAFYRQDKKLAQRVWDILKHDKIGINCIKEKKHINGLTVPSHVVEYEGMDSGLGMSFMNGIFALEYLKELIDFS